jgi:hypothetical protein
MNPRPATPLRPAASAVPRPGPRCVGIDLNHRGEAASAVWRDGRQEVSMIGNGWLQIAIFGAIVVAITKPFGFYMTRVFVGEWTPLSPLFATGRAARLSLLRRRGERRTVLAPV